MGRAFMADRVSDQCRTADPRRADPGSPPDKDESQIEGAMGRTKGADHRGQGRAANASATRRGSRLRANRPR